MSSFSHRPVQKNSATTMLARVADRRQRGLGLLECAAALALAGLVLASGAHAMVAAASIVRKARLLSAAVDIARNLLEREIGAPCAAPASCPAEFRCQVSRAGVTANADHLTVRAERIDGAASEELHTLAPVPACSG